MNTSRFTTELKRAIEIAQAIAKENYHPSFSTPHLLKAIMHNEVGLAATLAVWGKDIHYIREWADIRIEDLPKAASISDDILGDEKIALLLEMADMERLKLGEDTLSPLAVLAAMCKPDIAFSKEQLKSFPITEKEVLEASIQETAIQDAITPTINQESIKATNSKALYKYCINKTEQAKSGKIDGIVGRDSETRMMIEILGKRNKPNPVIVGEPGVGKTALVEGFALNIANGNVPNNLKEALLFELDLGALIAGASYKGEIEDRLKKIITEIKQFDKAILFIDELHTLLDSKAGLGGIANLLKPELARGELTVIGATTNKEFREFIEGDPAFNRRFEKVIVEEPSVDVAIQMIKNIIHKYETHHETPITLDAVVEAVHLAKRYINDKRLPDAALDLIDTTMSAMKMVKETSSEEIDKIATELAKMNAEHTLEDYQWLEQQLENRLSPVLVGQLEDSEDKNSIQSPTAYKDFLNQKINTLKHLAQQTKESVDEEDIAAVIAVRTGIPIGKVQANEKERLLNMKEHLRKRVVGQEQALERIYEAVLESRAGLKKANQPVGSFFFCGPTGTGKTELAKALAEFLFNDEKALIRFDMSEFKEAHSPTALMLGAPPGFVGFEEGGILVNKVRQKPYSVILFDEIEKAHDSIFDLYLPMLDDGVLTDRHDKKADFSNTIILFTSNLGYKEIARQAEENGEIPNSNTIQEIMKNLKKPKSNENVFRPEFVGRMDAFVPFSPISEEVAGIIFKIQLKSLVKALEKQGIALIVTDEAATFLTKKGHNPELGARPIRGIIRTELRQPIAKMIIAEKVKEGDIIKVEVENEELKIHC